MAKHPARGLWLVGALLVWLVGCQPAPPPATPVQAAATPAETPDSLERVSPAYIRDAVDLVQEQFVEEVPTEDLMRGALSGLSAYLRDRQVQDAAVESYDPRASDAVQSFVSLLSDVMGRHAERLEEDALVYASLRGLMAAVKDPYSVALDPKEYSQLTEQMSGGNFGGIGIYIERDKHNHGQLTVVEGVEGSPAVRAGIVAGDLIIKINNAPTEGMDLEVAADKVRGPVGTSLHLEVQHPGGASRDYRLLRELIHVKSAAYRNLGDHLGYIKLRFFGQDTNDEFNQALMQCERDGCRALVLDLRNNGGGYIKAAIDVCSYFLTRGSVVVSVLTRSSSPEFDRAVGNHHVHLPMVVLVNGYSASASEITAGALQDAGVAVLLGTQTYGKASVQTIHDLPDGGALKFTIAHYLTPKGRNINKKGIEPDIVVKMPADRVGLDNDVQLSAAADLLRHKLSATGSAP